MQKNKIKKATLERATNKQLDDTTVLSVLQALKNAKYPLTRKELTEYLHLKDRTVREAIETLRENAIPVCSTSSQAGYWIGTDAEYEAYVVSEDISRMRTMQKRHKAWKNRPIEGQVTM